jgi:hypothetical protein
VSICPGSKSTEQSLATTLLTGWGVEAPSSDPAKSQHGGEERAGRVRLSEVRSSESTTGTHTSTWSFSSQAGGEGELLLPDLGRKQQLERKRGGKEKQGMNRSAKMNRQMHRVNKQKVVASHNGVVFSHKRE